MPLVNMMSKEEEGEHEGMEMEPEPPEYPYGLCLHLEQEQLDKLSFSPSGTGQVVRVTALAKVVTVEQREDEEYGATKSVRLQITDMEVSDQSARLKV